MSPWDTQRCSIGWRNSFGKASSGTAQVAPWLAVPNQYSHLSSLACCAPVVLLREYSTRIPPGCLFRTLLPVRVRLGLGGSRKTQLTTSPTNVQVGASTVIRAPECESVSLDGIAQSACLIDRSSPYPWLVESNRHHPSTGAVRLLLEAWGNVQASRDSKQL